MIISVTAQIGILAFRGAGPHTITSGLLGHGGQFYLKQVDSPAMVAFFYAKSGAFV